MPGRIAEGTSDRLGSIELGNFDCKPNSKCSKVRYPEANDRGGILAVAFHQDVAQLLGGLAAVGVPFDDPLDGGCVFHAE